MKNGMAFFSLLLVAAAAFSAESDSTDLIFKDDIVHSYELQFSAANWIEQLNANKKNGETYMSAKFIYRGPASDSIVLDSVGVRYKGNSSYSLAGDNIKKSFKISFDEYVDTQTFFDCKTMNLNNCISDPSYMREKIGYDIIRRYTPAPRVAYAKLSVNGQLIGIYTQVEQVDKRFLKRNFEKNGGSLFKAADGGAGLSYAGPNATDYAALYEIKENEDNPAAWTNFISVLRNLSDSLSGNAAIVNATKSSLNYTNCIQHIAWTIVLSHFDSYTESGRNYYMYDDPASGQLFMIPWDVNMAFGQFPSKTDDITNNAFAPANMSIRPLIKVIMQNDSLKNLYIYWLRDMLNGPAHPDTIAKEADRLKAIISPVILAEPAANKFYTVEQFNENIEKNIDVGDAFTSEIVPGIKSFAMARYSELNRQITAGVAFHQPATSRVSGLRLSCRYDNNNACISIDYGFPGKSGGTIAVFDGMGKVVGRFARDDASGTSGRFMWKTGAVKAGVYVVSLSSGSSTVSSRVIIAK